jgi:ABC-type Fe3+ transport system permease subunit
MLAYDYPILGIFFTMMWIFIWMMWIYLLFKTIADIFRSDDLSGFSKVLWLLVVLVLPYLGVFIYVIVRGQGMTRRDRERHQAAEDSFRQYVRETASSGSADELAKLADLRERGVINDQEFEQQKAKILS